jgi:hypothetical protein
MEEKLTYQKESEKNIYRTSILSRWCHLSMGKDTMWTISDLKKDSFMP